MGRGILLMLLAALLSACGAPTGPAVRDLRYSLAGGIGGADKQVTLSADGSYSLFSRGQEPVEGRLAAREAEDLRRLMAEVDWVTLMPRYADPRVADALIQTVTVRREDGREWTIVVGTGGQPPAELAALLAFLDGLVQNLQTE